MNKPKLSIVVPCYNEAKNLPLLVEAFNEVIKRDDIEVVLVNNGSTDNSSEVISELLPKYQFLKTCLVPVNQGYGFGILTGLKEASGEFIGWTHGDLQTHPRDVIKTLEIIEANNNNQRLFIKGVRRGRKLFDMIFTWGMNIFETLYMGRRLFDINAQPNVFHCSTFERWQNPPTDFALDLFALYSASVDKLKIIRFDVNFPPRIHGVSTWNTSLNAKWKFIKRTINFSLALKHRLD